MNTQVKLAPTTEDLMANAIRPLFLVVAARGLFRGDAQPWPRRANCANTSG